LIKVTLAVMVYYALTLGSLLFFMVYFPDAARDLLPVGGLDHLTSGDPFSQTNGPIPIQPAAAELPLRALSLLNSLLGTLIFAAPIAWVYRRTRGGKQADSVVETLILLPVVVTTIVIVVQNSIALAFSLFGIVAAVRFRNNLKNPADAVFVFAALAVGLAAGVSEIGIAGMGSMVFCVTVLVLRIIRLASPPPTESLNSPLNTER